MRASEFIVEMSSGGATCSGAIAPVVAPLGMQRRSNGSMLAGKYTNDPTPNTPDWMKKLKGKKRAK